MSVALLPEFRVVELAHATTECAGKILAERRIALHRLVAERAVGR